MSPNGALFDFCSNLGVCERAFDLLVAFDVSGHTYASMMAVGRNCGAFLALVACSNA